MMIVMTKTMKCLGSDQDGWDSRVSSTFRNAGSLQDLEIYPANTGNLLKFGWSSLKFLAVKQQNTAVMLFGKH